MIPAANTTFLTSADLECFRPRGPVVDVRADQTLAGMARPRPDAQSFGVILEIVALEPTLTVWRASSTAERLSVRPDPERIGTVVLQLWPTAAGNLKRS